MALISFPRIAALLSALPLLACGPSAEEDRAKAGPIVGPFVVSNFYTPSGFMGDGAVPNRLTVDINRNCREPRPPGAQGDCYRFTYRPGDVKWAGAFWVAPANNWGTEPGRDVVGPLDMGIPDPDKPGSPNLRRYNHVRASYSIFRLRHDGQLEVLPNEQKVRFWAGKLDGRASTPPQPYYDIGCFITSKGVPDCTDENQVPPAPYFFNPADNEVVINGDVQQLEYDLSRWSVQQLIAGFGFSLNADKNPASADYPALVLYLDDIVWE
jgi:hypothetical protein